MNTIETNTVATVQFTLKTQAGELIEQGDELAYLHGYNNLLDGMELALEGKSIGQHITSELKPENMFGELVEEEPIQIHKSQFGNDFEKLYEGIAIPTRDTAGNEIVIYLQEKKGDFAVLSRNHPLAGVPLIFDAKIINVRNALPGELVDRIASGPNGDQKPSSCACC
jgi:FKBP-type peptidyl-prolyl cis-trans isomerase SlyD